jgi:preprotein translocase subunit YajC
MWNDALAQTGGAAGAAAPNSLIGTLVSFGPIIIIMVIMYLVLIYPQQQRQKKTDAMVKALKKGDRVLTTGGIIGTVVGVDDAKAVLRIGEEADGRDGRGVVKVEFAKSAIVQVLSEAK